MGEQCLAGWTGWIFRGHGFSEADRLERFGGSQNLSWKDEFTGKEGHVLMRKEEKAVSARDHGFRF